MKKIKKIESKIEKIMRIISLCAIIFALLVLVYAVVYHYRTGAFTLEFTIKGIAKEGEEYSHSGVIRENKGIGFINYNCTPINQVTKGIQDCTGQYYVFSY